MRHNAELHVKCREGKPYFTFYITHRGDPKYVKEFARLTFRDRRRDIMSNPQEFAVNLFCRANLSSRVTIFPDPGEYAFTYHFNLIPTVPTVRVTSHISGEKDSFNLFAWIGPQRRISEIASKKRSISHKPVGRPSDLSKMKEPLPENFK